MSIRTARSECKWKFSPYRALSPVYLSLNRELGVDRNVNLFEHLVLIQHIGNFVMVGCAQDLVFVRPVTVSRVQEIAIFLCPELVTDKFIFLLLVSKLY